jgi:sensor histidine kinase regulating citrate/malate metabolism
VNVLTIILIVFAVLVIVLAVGGYVANARRRERERAALLERAEQADQHLAAAHAEDKGWERSTLEAAARAIYADRHGSEPRELHLVQVVDRPGTDEDEAVFMADGAELRLGRRGGDWVGA